MTTTQLNAINKYGLINYVQRGGKLLSSDFTENYYQVIKTFYTRDKTNHQDAPENKNQVLTVVQLSDLKTSEDVKIAEIQFLKGVQEKGGEPNSIFFLK